MKPKVKKVLTKIWQDKKDNSKWLEQAIEKDFECVLNVGWRYVITQVSKDIDNPFVCTEYYYGIEHDELLTLEEPLTEEELKSGLYWDLFTHIPIAEITSLRVEK